MSLEYEEVLAPSGGLYRYRYVLSTERYSSQPLEAVSVTVNLRSQSGLASLYSSSHPIQTERLGSGRAKRCVSMCRSLARRPKASRPPS